MNTKTSNTMRTYKINTNKDLQLDFDYGHFQELAKEIINDVYKGHNIQYIGSGRMAWEHYDFAATIDNSTVKAHIDYKSKTCTLTETKYGKPVDILEEGAQRTKRLQACKQALQDCMREAKTSEERETFYMMLSKFNNLHPEI